MHFIIHAGPPKTGSTALQLALFKNAEILARAGIRHVVGPRPGEWALAFSYGDHAMRQTLPRVMKRYFSTFEDARIWSEQNWDRLEQIARQERPEIMLISSEHYANLARPEDFIARLRAISERVTLVAYARDPVSLYVSELDELIRGGTALEQLRLPQRYGYYSMRNLKKFEQVLGPENIVIRNFDRANLVGGDIGRDFFALLSELLERRVQGQDFPSEVNSSICAVGTAWILMLNSALPVEAGGVELFRALHERRQKVIEKIRSDETLAGLPRLKLTDPVLEQLVRQHAQPVVDWINEIYMEGQIPLKSVSDQIEVPGPAKTRTRMRDWLLGYLDSNAMQTLGQVLI